MITATVKDTSLLGIGIEIKYSHRAAVARIKKWYPESKRFGWVLTEGVYKNEMSELLGEETRHLFFDWPVAKFSHGQTYNKTVMVWPDNGFGWIMGKVRRSIGHSEKSYYTSSGPWGDSEFEQGYHTTDMYVDLYAIKQYYIGVEYILCPWWAVSRTSDEK